MIAIINLNFNIWIHEHRIINSKVRIQNNGWRKVNLTNQSILPHHPKEWIWMNLRKSKIINVVLHSFDLSLILWKKNLNFAKPLKFCIQRRIVENIEQGWNKFANILTSTREVSENVETEWRRKYMWNERWCQTLFFPWHYLFRNSFFFSIPFRKYVNHKWEKTFKR